MCCLHYNYCHDHNHQNVIHHNRQATKYAIFDPTKEMTYIPLSKEAKTQVLLSCLQSFACISARSLPS